MLAEKTNIADIVEKINALPRLTDEIEEAIRVAQSETHLNSSIEDNLLTTTYVKFFPQTPIDPNSVYNPNETYTHFRPMPRKCTEVCQGTYQYCNITTHDGLYVKIDNPSIGSVTLTQSEWHKHTSHSDKYEFSSFLLKLLTLK